MGAPSWPDPYPQLLARLWHVCRGTDDVPPPLPELSQADSMRPASDPFWCDAFTQFLARIFRWHYLRAAELAGEPLTWRPHSATPAPKTPAEPTVPAGPAGPAEPAEPAEPIGPAEPVAGMASIAVSPSSKPTPTPSIPAAKPLDFTAFRVALRTALERLPRDFRPSLAAEFMRESDATESTHPTEAWLRRACDVAELLNRTAAVFPDVEPAATEFLAALAQSPYITTQTASADFERAPAAEKAGQFVRLLRPGVLNAAGQLVDKPRVLLSSRHVAPLLARFEPLADALDAHAPGLDKAATFFLRRAADVIDSKAKGDPAAPEAVSLLKDCVRFATELAYVYARPEFRTVLSGVGRLIDEAAEALKIHGWRVFPSAVQPYREGRAVPAPLSQAVVKEIPDLEPAGRLLRIRRRGYLFDGKTEQEPILFVSKGPTPTALATGLSQLAIEARRTLTPFKTLAAFVDRMDKLVLDWLAAPTDRDAAVALRFLVNFADETAADGGIRHAADHLCEHLRERHALRSIGARIGDTLNDGFAPVEWDFERHAGSGRPSQSIVHVKRRVFKDDAGLVLQKGLLLIAV